MDELGLKYGEIVGLCYLVSVSIDINSDNIDYS